MKIIDWVNQSKNYTKGREGRKVKYIAIHWIAVGTGESAAKYLLNNSKNTSAHFVVEDANVWRLVNTEDTAHAVGNWVANTESISIEHSATPDRPASELTYQTSAELIKQLCDLYQLPINEETIKPHKAFSATACPGTIDIPKLIKLATQGNTESEKDKKIAELEKEKDYFEKQVKELNKEIKSLKNDVKDRETTIDVLNELNGNLSEEVKQLKVSVEKALKKAEDSDASYLDLETQLIETNNRLNKQNGEIERITTENKLLHTANVNFASYLTATKLFKYKNYSVILLEKHIADVGKMV